ncbi:MAG: hypothetical protein J6A30_09490 [Ruminococcus sp.]|nr:hypothetical protein [Ruminococcus sp.]
MGLEEAIQYAEDLGTEEENKIDYGKDSPHSIIRRKNTVKDYRQLAEWLRELKDLREENKVLIRECDRLIKEKGELLKKSEQIAEYKRLLKVAVEDINYYVDCYEAHCDECCCDHDNHCHWKHEAEALALIGEEGENDEKNI